MTAALATVRDAAGDDLDDRRAPPARRARPAPTPSTTRAHLAMHGALPGADLARLLDLLDAAGLAGRGGAGFPLATKLRSLRGPSPDGRRQRQRERAGQPQGPHAAAPHPAPGARRRAGRRRRGRRARGDRRRARPRPRPTRCERAVRERPDARRVRVERTGGAFVGRRGPHPAARARRRAGAAARAPRAADRATAGWCRTSRRSRRSRCCCGSARAASPRPARATSRARRC